MTEVVPREVEYAINAAVHTALMMHYFSAGLEPSRADLADEAEAITDSVLVPVAKALRSAQAASPGTTIRRESPLTDREIQVLASRIPGTPREVTAREMGITISGVNSLLESAVKKLGADNQMHAFYIATVEGYI